MRIIFLQVKTLRFKDELNILVKVKLFTNLHSKLSLEDQKENVYKVLRVVNGQQSKKRPTDIISMLIYSLYCYQFLFQITLMEKMAIW